MRVAAVIPAKNEAFSIADCLKSLLSQTYPISKIIVVNDGSTDETGEIVKAISQVYPQVCCLDKPADGTLRAGAVNKGLEQLELKDFDLVLIADADVLLDSKAIEEAVKSIEKDETIGGVCSSVGLRGKGLLHRLQKLEYGGFNAERTATWENVMIIHGLCGLFRLEALKKVGGFSEGHLLEDYDLTLKLKKAGYKTIFNPRMKASTKSVEKFKKLVRQRIRWYRGGIDVILEHGINRFTAYDAFSHLQFILLFLVVSSIVGLAIAQLGKWNPRPFWHPIPILLFIIGLIDGIWRLKWVKERDWVDIILRLALLPELIYSTFLSGLRIYSYLLALGRVRKSW